MLEAAPEGATGPVWKMFVFDDKSALELLPLPLPLVCCFPSSFFPKSGFVHFLLKPPKPPLAPFEPKENPLELPFEAVAGAPKGLGAPFGAKPWDSGLVPNTLGPPKGLVPDGCGAPLPNADGVAAVLPNANDGALGLGTAVGA